MGLSFSLAVRACHDNANHSHLRFGHLLDFPPQPKLSRRAAIGAAAGLLGSAAVGLKSARAQDHSAHGQPAAAEAAPVVHAGHGDGQNENIVMGTVDNERNGFDPHAILTDFDYGRVKTDPDGRAVREWIVTAIEKGGVDPSGDELAFTAVRDALAAWRKLRES